MKKFFMSLAAVSVMALAAGFTSCDPNKEQCWKITLASPDGTQTMEYYYFGNGVDSDAQLDLLASSHPGYKATKTQTFLSRDNCKK